MSGTDRPVDLTQERYDRFAAALDNLFEHQKSLANLVSGGQQDVAARFRRLDDLVAGLNVRLTIIEEALHEFRMEHASQMNQILSAQQEVLRASMRMDRLEEAIADAGRGG